MYMDRQVEAVEDHRIVRQQVARIANAKFNTTTEVEDVITELRTRIFAIGQLKQGSLH